MQLTSTTCASTDWFQAGFRWPTLAETSVLTRYRGEASVEYWEIPLSIASIASINSYRPFNTRRSEGGVAEKTNLV